MKCNKKHIRGDYDPGSLVDQPSVDSKLPAKTWHCGTLTYTTMGLVSLFGFMIWGDYCNVLMGYVVPSIMPLKLKGLGASNVLIVLFSVTVPSIMSVLLNPYISFKSDRCRIRWGRRIPFILFTLPPLCLSLVALAFGEDDDPFPDGDGHRLIRLHLYRPLASRPNHRLLLDHGRRFWDLQFRVGLYNADVVRVFLVAHHGCRDHRGFFQQRDLCRQPAL